MSFIHTTCTNIIHFFKKKNVLTLFIVHFTIQLDVNLICQRVFLLYIWMTCVSYLESSKCQYLSIKIACIDLFFYNPPVLKGKLLY